MPYIHKETSGPSLHVFALRCAVHFDALTRSPGEYLRSVWWHVTGKKMRARIHLSPLLGASSRAYDLWRAQRKSRIDWLETSKDERVTVKALIRDGDKAHRTLESCRGEEIEAYVVANPRDLAKLDIGDHEWVLPLFPGDTLAQGAGAQYRLAVAAASPADLVIYADDDLIDQVGSYTAPHFKPEWNSELFRHFDFLTGAAILKKTAFGEFANAGIDWPKSLIARALTSTAKLGGRPVHLPYVLHHRRWRPAPKLPDTLSGSCDNLPSVSVIIPTRNRLDLLRPCLDGLRRTEYRSGMEVLVIDNGSDDEETLDYLASLDGGGTRVLRDDSPFNFAALNNRAVESASGELLCFLNNDVEILDPSWLEAMAVQAIREEVGAVGAQLLYPDGRIQHAGVVLGIGGAAAHAHRTLQPNAEGYFHRHALPQFVSAVTAACMVVSRKKFEAVGGFDAENFAVSFNDVDLCMRLGMRGWHSLYEPRATLVHHESVSRGLDRDREGAARQVREVAALQSKWHTGLTSAKRATNSADPNHHPELSRFSELFVLDL